jgi:hypothetical protein
MKAAELWRSHIQFFQIWVNLGKKIFEGNRAWDWAKTGLSKVPPDRIRERDRTFVK